MLLQPCRECRAVEIGVGVNGIPQGRSIFLLDEKIEEGVVDGLEIVLRQREAQRYVRLQTVDADGEHLHP